MTKQKEEYITTPGGFCKLEIDLDADSIETLVDIWVDRNLHPASVELYTEARNDGADQDTALKSAVLNDAMIAALTQHLDAQSE